MVTFAQKSVKDCQVGGYGTLSDQHVVDLEACGCFRRVEVGEVGT